MRVKTLALAIASSCLFYSVADAASLGKLTVLSALGQPLRAEIELTSVTKEDAGNLTPRLASAEAYRQANVGYSSNLSSLIFTIEERGSRRFVLVTSTQSVTEPFLEILVELNSSSGKLIREYTLLLDPVEMQANNPAMSTSSGFTVSAQPAVPVPSSAPSTQSVTPAAPVAPARPAAVASKNVATADGDHYQIKSGDTLSKIANQYKPNGVSLEQMLVALQRKNSAAFIDNNMNLLRSGRVLNIPDAAAIADTTQSEAKKIVLAQSTDFNSFRNRMANQVEQAKPEKPVEPKKTDTGKITAKVVEAPTTVNTAADKLKLSKAQQDKDLADKKTLEEDRIAKQRALDSANERVKELEANTAKLQNILDLKNKTASAPDEQKDLADHKSPAVAATVAASLPAVAASVPASVPEVKPKVIAAAPEPEPGFFDQYMKYLPYGGIVLALLGGFGLIASKRKKKPEHFDDENLLTGSSIKTNSLFGSTGGQSVDTNNSVFNSNFAPSASQLDANEVDPVAEADVYIAYGRDEQAEEILKEALRTQPDRQAVRVKLLEIYAHRKDTRTFETVASELYGMTGGIGPEWAQAASLGVIIDPQNPLYAGGNNNDSTAPLGASTLPVESLDPEALLGNSLSQDMLDSITLKNDTGSSMMMDGDINDRTHRTDFADGGLDFDLGLTTNPEPEDDYGATPIANLAKETPVSPDFMLDDLPAPEHHEEEEPVSVAPSPRVAPTPEPEPAPMDFAALDFDFDIPKSQPEKLTPIESATLQEHEDDHPDHDSTQAEVRNMATAETLDYDLSSINLDLHKSEPETAPETPDFAAEHAMDFEIAGNPTLDLQHSVAEENVEVSAEMATKLDLAIAYQEIGDKDGARELLDEVLKGGSEEQISRARTLMHELG